ncbi:MAG: beta-lactamase family protein, partial [Acetobacteraceae bacterium]|nr:beta-lactamase family protein [Acetobacteraceae bacterium]
MVPSLNDIFAPVTASIAIGRLPGAVLAVLAPDGTRQTIAAGMAALVPDRVKMTADTWFDLASLTKVVFTTTAILKLVEAGRISPDDPLTDAIPDLRQYHAGTAPERGLTFRQCLSHQTHLPAVEPLYTYGQ